MTKWIAAAFWTAGCLLGMAGDWPVHRGPNGDSIADESGWKVAPPTVLWKADVGLGYSGMVVAGGKVYSAGHDGKADSVVSLDAESGAVMWKHTFPQPTAPLYYQGGTTGCPTVDDERVFHVAREGEVFALDAKTGAVVWQTHLKKDHDLPKPEWGFTGAPRVYGDTVLFNAGAAGIALRKSDGAVVWKSGKEEAGYATPFLFSKGGQDHLILTNKREYVCVDPRTGTERWRHKWLTRYGVNASEPVVSGDAIFISTGYGKGACLLEWKGAGTPAMVWQNRDMANQMNPSILLDGHLFGIHGNESQDGTGLRCMELSTGRVLWTETSVSHGAVLAANGQLLVISEQGHLMIGPASPKEWKPAFRVPVIEGRVWTQPVLAQGRLHVRNQKGEIVCLDLR
jgi:outer membrane protein assembly factor BamB